MEPFSPSHSCSFLNWELMIIMKKPFVMFFNKILYWPLSTQVKVRVLGILFASSFTFSLPYSLPLFLSLFCFLLLAHLNRQRGDVGANGNGIVARRNGEIVGDAFSVFYHASFLLFPFSDLKYLNDSSILVSRIEFLRIRICSFFDIEFIQVLFSQNA